MPGKIQIEFFKSHYGSTKLFVQNSEPVDLNGRFTEILMHVSKGFEWRIADGDTIFFLTEKQFDKLKKMIHAGENS